MALTKTVDGKPLPPEQFAYVGDSQDPSTWHLPVDHDHLQSALDLFGHETHVPDAKKSATARKIAAKAKDAGLDTSDFEKKYCGSEHADFSNGWVEIFRAGTYPGKGTFTPADLDRIVSNFNPSFHEAPAVVGHPKDDAPAYGWVSALKRDGDTLLAQFKEVDPAFEQMVKGGRYKKRSAAFYTDGGQIAGLRHVGFLGAQPPEVKGLKNLNFADAGRSYVDFGEEDTVAGETEKTFREQFTAFFAELLGKKPGDGGVVTFNESEVRRMIDGATKPLVEKITKLEGDLGTQTTKFSERERQIATGETKQRAVTAMNKLKADGRWVPAFEKMGLSLVFDELAKHTETVEFGEGDAKKKVTPLDLLVTFLEGLPKMVPDGRVFSGARPADRKPGTVHFTEGRGVKADANSIALNDQAAARAKEKSISFGEALDQIVAEHPELCVPGGAQAGAV